MVMIIAVAKLLIFSGKISPNKARGTGPRPILYPKAVVITLNGNSILLILMKVSF